MEPEKTSINLYETLPKHLGGRNERPASVSLPALLPFPPGAKIPTDEEINSKVRNRALLLEGDAKPKQTKEKVEKLRRKGRKTAGKVVIPKAEQRYELYVPLMQLWKDYASKLVAGDNIANSGDRVLRMDLHGAPIEVIRSRDPGLVGVQGILVVETANTVIVVTEQNKAKTIPKNISVIRLRFADVSVEISLPALQFRASERSARKIKKRHFSPL